MTALNKQALREAAEKATALNLDTAQVKRGNDGYLECPCCEGAGYVEEENDFCNIDGVALGVQFYGIGEHHGLAESYLRAANPATVLALLDELEAAEKRIAEKRIAEQSEIVAAAEKLVRCKGRYHSELNYRALAKLFGVTTPDLPPLKHENVHYADAAEMEIAALRQRIAELEARTPYGYLRQCDRQIQISIGSERPHDRSGGYATPWFAIYTATGIGVKGE